MLVASGLRMTFIILYNHYDAFTHREFGETEGCHTIMNPDCHPS